MGSEATLDATIPPVPGRENPNPLKPLQSQRDEGSAEECPPLFLFHSSPPIFTWRDFPRVPLGNTARVCAPPPTLPGGRYTLTLLTISRISHLVATSLSP